MGEGPKQRPGGNVRLLPVFTESFGGHEVQANGPVFPALFLQADGGVLAVIVEISHGQFTSSRDACAGVQIETQNRPVRGPPARRDLAGRPATAGRAPG